MKIIDAFTGQDMADGHWAPLPPGWGTKYRVVSVSDKLFWASAQVEMVDEMGRRVEKWPLTVRFTHPSYFLQRVAFVET